MLPVALTAICSITLLVLSATGLDNGAVHDLFPNGVSDIQREYTLKWALCLMFLHKIESWIQGEPDAAIEYAEMAQKFRPTQIAFVCFYAAFFLVFGCAYLLLSAPPAPMLVLLVWQGQGQFEIHHFAKSVYRGDYYPGTATGCMFVAYMAVVAWPAFLANSSIAPEMYVYCHMGYAVWLMSNFVFMYVSTPRDDVREKHQVTKEEVEVTKVEGVNEEVRFRKNSMNVIRAVGQC